MDIVTLGILLRKVSSISPFDYNVSDSAENTPYGVTFVKDGVTITGTLVASESTMHRIYFVPADDGTFREYTTLQKSGLYQWELLGSANYCLTEENHVLKIGMVE